MPLNVRPAFANMYAVEWVPSVMISFGFMTVICLSRKGVHVWISAGAGSRLFGGRHFRMFPMKTCALETPASVNSVSKNFPAAPTNGLPFTSSQWPGASPISIIFAFGLPSPGTAFLRDLCRGHFVQCVISSAMVFSWFCMK